MLEFLDNFICIVSLKRRTFLFDLETRSDKIRKPLVYTLSLCRGPKGKGLEKVSRGFVSLSYYVSGLSKSSLIMLWVRLCVSGALNSSLITCSYLYLMLRALASVAVSRCNLSANFLERDLSRLVVAVRRSNSLS